MLTVKIKISIDNKDALSKNTQVKYDLRKFR